MSVLRVTVPICEANSHLLTETSLPVLEVCQSLVEDCGDAGKEDGGEGGKEGDETQR